MGSPLRLTIVNDPQRAAAAWKLMRADFEATEAALSRFRRDSDLTRLNRTAGGDAWYRPSPRLRRMLISVRRAHRVTGGRFDPRVVRALERIGERAGIPLPMESGTDRPWIEVGAQGGARVTEPLDSGGIGKGLALRWAAGSLARAGMCGSGGMIDAGGDLVAWGRPEDFTTWRIGIEDPFGDDVPLAVVELGSGAIATSSVRIRSWTDSRGDPVHHLIDAATGRPAQTELRAVSVAHADPAWAEIWSKSLFLGGLGGIEREARARGIAAWWVSTEGDVGISPRGKDRTIWVRPDSRPPG